MLKKTITYEDFNGELISEDFFFHLSKAELVELEMSYPGGMSTALQKIIDSGDGKTIIAEFKNIILNSYGQRSGDGKRFIKNQELRDEFESTEAYSTLFMELVTNADAAVEFIRGVIPPDMAQEAARIAERGDAPVIPIQPDPQTATNQPEEISLAQMQDLSDEEVLRLNARLASGEAVIVNSTGD